MRNVDRAVGGLLSHHVTKNGLSVEVEFELHGSAGQSFGAWLAPGIELTLVGDANDYVGKGLSGGVVAVRPPDGAAYRAEESVIVGNTVLYGATSGRAFFRGIAGERFAVRNSGAAAVVEGVGDHGCEYMTGGRVVVIGATGRNFAAGMSGGIAYVLDDDAQFAQRCNTQLVALEALESDDEEAVQALLAEHVERTGSPVAQALLEDWSPAPVREGDPARLQARARGARLGRRRRLLHDGDRRGRRVVGKIGAFLNLNRVEAPERPPTERVGDFREFVGTLPLVELREQASRCMECGVPFCHHGCPVGNLIPDWNDLVYRDRWQEALEQLHRTNNFPEFTAASVPLPCEAACVLEINEGDAVSIKQVELAIVNRGWGEGWVQPQPAARRTGRSVAVVGSGPGRARLRAAAGTGRRARGRLRARRSGGGPRPLRCAGVQIEKRLVERRVQQLVAEGVEFRFGPTSGGCHGAAELRERHDAVVIATGSRVPRDLPVPGRELDGVHFAMDTSTTVRARSRARRRAVSAPPASMSRDRRRRHRRGLRRPCEPRGRGVRHADRAARRAATVTSRRRHAWPRWPMKLRMSYALKEGGERSFAISTTRFTGADGRVAAIHWQENSRRAAVRADRRHRGVASRRARSLAMGFLGRRATCSISSTWSATRVAMPPLRAISPRPTVCSPPETRGAASR